MNSSLDNIKFSTTGIKDIKKLTQEIQDKQKELTVLKEKQKSLHKLTCVSCSKQSKFIDCSFLYVMYYEDCPYTPQHHISNTECYIVCPQCNIINRFYRNEIKELAYCKFKRMGKSYDHKTIKWLEEK